MPSNRSSSSSPLAVASSRSNPNLRNSEINNSIRRSFSGNPFHKPSIIANPRSFNPNTPANSPSDFTPRNSVGGGRENMGSLGELDDKENGKDHIFKSSKIRSPAASMKGMKNFMCPTISAAFKFTESPRKKVLTDKNEPARTPFSLSSLEGKSSPHRKVTFEDSVEEKKFQTFSGGIIKEETEKYKSPHRKVTFADSVEEKMFQPFPDGLWEEDSDEHAASMVSEDSSSDSIEEKKFQPFTDGVNKSSIVSEDLEAGGFGSKNETESECEPVNNEPDCVNLDPSFRLSPTPPPFSETSTIIAPLDADPSIPLYDLKADPSIPPYDPKVNYLSPRPQFLRYKPNPRLQLYKEMTSMKLDDGSSDTELTEEALSDGSENESEVSLDETGSGVQNHVSEASTLIPEEEIAETKGVGKQGFSMRSKAIALLLLLSVACFSVSYTNPQVFDPLLKEFATWSQTWDASEIHQFASANFDRFSELARENLDGLSRNFHIWFTKLMSSTSKLISSIRGVQESSVHLHYWNLTHLAENVEVYQFPTFGQERYLLQEAPQVAMPVLKAEEETEDFTDTSSVDVIADHYASAYEEQVVQELGPVPPITDDNDVAKEIDTDAVLIAEVESDSSASKIGEANAPNHSDIHAEVESAPSASEVGEASEPNQSETTTDYPDSGAHEIHTEDFEGNNFQSEPAPEKDAVSGSVNLKDQSDLNSEIHTDSKPESDVHTKVPHDVQLKPSDEKSVRAVIVASIILFLSIIAGAAFKYLKKKDEARRTRTMATTNAMEQPALLTKALQHKEEAASSLEKPFLRNNPVEMDVLGGSYQPSELSSYERSSSYYYSQRGLVEEQTEAQSSLEKKPKRSNRRESLASSSEMASGGSASYGSFTTYEKRGLGHGEGGGGAVTPVRRSSRIRNLATSPTSPL